MRFLVLATDYDGTLAERGHVDEAVWSSIRRLCESGRKAVMVTGRELEDLQVVCPHLDLFDRVVAENGALIYEPKTKEVRLLCEPPPASFAASLAAKGVTPLSVGHVIVATVKPYEAAVLNAINELGLELQVIFNQDAVMILPTGVNKATGLAIALKEMGYSPHNTVAIGDAENDHALLAACECGTAVGNAVPALKQRADLVVQGSAGAAVVELIDRILIDDLSTIGSQMTRHDILLGKAADGRELCISPHGINVLITGASGTGKSVLAAGLLERLAEAKYQYALFDSEGDYESVAGGVILGSPTAAPLAEKILNVLAANRSAMINLHAIVASDRPKYFNQLLTKVLEMRARLGRPHWIFLDEFHHLMTASWPTQSERLQTTAVITERSGMISPTVLGTTDLWLALGENAYATVAEFCRARSLPTPPGSASLQTGQALAYWPGRNDPPIVFTTIPARGERQRHRRRFAEGRLPDEDNFVFRGPKGKLRLRSQFDDLSRTG